MSKYDLVIIGAGPAGFPAAFKAAESGKKVALIEKEFAGGTCLNWGCIPTKTLAAAAKEFPEDYKKVFERKGKVVEALRGAVAPQFAAKKIDFLAGIGKFNKAAQVELTSPDGKTEIIEADNILIATGSVPMELPGLKFDHQKIISSRDLLKSDTLPKKLLVVGGGVIGCEFASILAKFGVKVTIVEMMKQLIPTEERFFAKRLEAHLKEKGIEVLTDTTSDSVNLALFDKVLVAVGRRANTEGLGLEAAGIKTDEKNRVVVDRYFKTNLDHVWAAGDVIPGIMLAHVASYEGELVVDNIFEEKKEANYQVVPNVIFTDPEIASVGINEDKARSLNMEYTKAQISFAANGKAQAMGQADGFFKLIADKSKGTILGASIIGPQATELIAQVALAVAQKLTVHDIQEVIYAHPTLSEIFPEACRRIR